MKKRFDWKLWLMDMMSLADDFDDAMFMLKCGQGWVMEFNGKPVDELREMGFVILDEWCKDWVE